MSQIRFALLSALLLFAALSTPVRGQSVVTAPKPAAPTHKKPTLEERTAAYFASRKDLKPGELIVRSDVESLVKTLAKEGYDTKAFDPLLKQTVADQSLLARQLRSPAGKGFARQAAQYPGGYDRLEHLANLPDGPNTLQKLVEGPDGYKLIEYMTTTSGGQEMGRMLSETPTGGNFNGKTGRIYTADQLVAQLKENAKPKLTTPKSRRRP